MIDIHVNIRYESEEDRLMVIKIINQQNHITRYTFSIQEIECRTFCYI